MTEHHESYQLSNLHYVCSDCAHDLNATWPDSHVATFHCSLCDVCNLEKSICSARNWNWPQYFPRRSCPESLR